MIHIVFLVLSVLTMHTSAANFFVFNEKKRVDPGVSVLMGVMNAPAIQSLYPVDISAVNVLLHQYNHQLSESVIDKVLTALECSSEHHVARSPILTIIDYSLPSNQKRLWVFHLREKRLLFHTYVSHGIKSGALLTHSFSNRYNSKASSLGVYKTQQAYYGREGLSLRLDGLEAHFNDNASSRAIVMHGGWYVNDYFIKRYGRPGRSWGCPAIPPDLTKSLINTIKDHSLFVVYYPSDSWFAQSKFLNCSSNRPFSSMSTGDERSIPLVAKEVREDVLFADTHQHKTWHENDPIVVVSADHYENFFHTRPPVDRMLRRQINHVEYIALSVREINQLMQLARVNGQSVLSQMYFVVPEIVMVRGYYETLMKVVNLGKINALQTGIESGTHLGPHYTLYFENRPAVQLRATDRFIRWVGL